MHTGRGPHAGATTRLLGGVLIACTPFTSSGLDLHTLLLHRLSFFPSCFLRINSSHARDQIPTTYDLRSTRRRYSAPTIAPPISSLQSSLGPALRGKSHLPPPCHVSSCATTVATLAVLLSSELTKLRSLSSNYAPYNSSSSSSSKLAKQRHANHKPPREQFTAHKTPATHTAPLHRALPHAYAYRQ